LVFLSHAREDRRVALRLATDLGRLGVDVWIDVHMLLPGDNWKLAVSDAIEKCDYFIALLSVASVGKRGHVQRELREALEVLDQLPEGERFAIPCRIDDCTIPRRLRDRNAVDLFPSWDEGFALLARLFDTGSGTAEARCPLCGSGDHVGAGRLSTTQEFAYLFTRLDQLGSGAWGASVASWMREVGKERADFELHDAIGVEGGIETTAICCQGLAQAWAGGRISDSPWATRCREYFRARQSTEDGSIGYLRNAFRDATPLIESTCRHTAQAALALAELGRNSTGLIDALRYTTQRITGSGVWDAKEIARNASREDRYPGMVLAATLRAARVCERNARQAPTAGWPTVLPPGADAEMLAALARIDPEHYPFFKPYGLLNTMRRYSFLAIVDMVADQELVFLGDRVRDGIAQILDAVDDRGGLAFWPEATSPDFGIMAFLVAVLHAEPVLDVLDTRTRRRATEIRSQSLGWLLDKVDRYSDEPELFSYLVSGNMSRLLVLPTCRQAPLTPERLETLDNVVDELRRSSTRSEDAAVRQQILHRVFAGSTVDTRAFVALLDEKAAGVERSGR
jgi:hypothetical protein